MKPDPSAVKAQAVQHNGRVRATSNSVTQKSRFNTQNQSNENTAGHHPQCQVQLWNLHIAVRESVLTCSRGTSTSVHTLPSVHCNMLDHPHTTKDLDQTNNSRSCSEGYLWRGSISWYVNRTSASPPFSAIQSLAQNNYQMGFIWTSITACVM